MEKKKNLFVEVQLLLMMAGILSAMVFFISSSWETAHPYPEHLVPISGIVVSTEASSDPGADEMICDVFYERLDGSVNITRDLEIGGIVTKGQKILLRYDPYQDLLIPMCQWESQVHSLQQISRITDISGGIMIVSLLGFAMLCGSYYLVLERQTV